MCLKSTRKQYRKWVDEQQMHPFWLELKDKAIQRRYEESLRIEVAKYVKVGCIIHLIYTLLTLVINF